MGRRAMDIVLGLVAVLFGMFGWQNGFFPQLGRLIVVGGAVAGAKFAAVPTARFLVTGIDWTPAMATGSCYLAYFGLLTMVGNFILGRLFQSMRDNASDGSGLDRGVGTLLGLATGTIVVYGLLCGAQLVTQHLGASNPALALQYQTSKVGRFVLTHNFADPEPFPHAKVLEALVGTEDPLAEAPEAIGAILLNPKWIAIKDSPETLASLERSDWRTLRRDPKVLELVTDVDFLKAADALTRPNHDAKPEEPTDRFKELH